MEDSSSDLSVAGFLSIAVFVLSSVAEIMSRRHNEARDQDVRSSVHNKSIRLVRYLSENHGGWHSYTNTQELFVQEFPKIELHVHLDGAFDPDVLWKYMQQHPESIYCLPVCTDLPWEQQPSKDDNGEIRPKQLAVRSMVEKCSTSRDFHALCTCRGHRSLKAMLNCFEIFLPLVRRNLELLEQLAFDFVQRQWEQNTVYTEVRYSPFLLAEGYNDNAQQCETADHDTVNGEMVFQAITKGLRRGCQKFHGIIINQILSAITWRPDFAQPTLDLVCRYQNDYPCATVGIDIAAGEEHFNAQEFPALYQPHYEMIQKAKNLGIPITLHAGESTPQAMKNVERAILEYGAKRIGHGYRMVENRDLMHTVKEHNVHVEVCPTSSLETGGWVFTSAPPSTPSSTHSNDSSNGGTKNWSRHPCIVMKEEGISFSLSSDDPAVFHTSLAWQYRIALAKMNFTREELLETNIHAVNAAFCSEKVKESLRALLFDYGLSKHLKTNVSKHPTRMLDGSMESFESSRSAPAEDTKEGPTSSINYRYPWKRSLSESFTDRVYVSKSIYF